MTIFGLSNRGPGPCAARVPAPCGHRMTGKKLQKGGEIVTTEYLLNREVLRVLAALMPQNQLIVRLVLHTGMRISDALELRTDQLKPTGWYVEKKTGKRRRYGIPRPLLEEIRAQAGPVWAFPGQAPGRHKTRQAVWADVKRAARAFRMPQNVGTHSFRKAYAVGLMEKYGDIRRVQRNLNHSSPSVTAVYAMADVLLERRLRRKTALDKPAATGVR